MLRSRLAALAILFTTACSMPGWLKAPLGSGRAQPIAEATSLLGEPLYRPPLDKKFQRRQEDLLRQAREELAASPADPDRLIWVGRRTAYLGRYQEAVEIYTEGIAAHPDDARLYRHRGHRYLTLRQLAKAIADLERAAELIAGKPDQVEPDGLPNAAGIPTSTLATNIWYHLGLARYLQAEYDKAVAAYDSCLAASTHKDMFVATSYWRYLALRRAGRPDEAARALEPIRPDMKLLENHAYHRLMLLFAQRLRPQDVVAGAREAGGLEFATTAYGAAAWYELTGEADRAEQLRSEIIKRESLWPAFGYLAAEADLARGETG